MVDPVVPAGLPSLPPTCATHIERQSQVTAAWVHYGPESFLVVSMAGGRGPALKTVLFELIRKPDCLIQRREIVGALDPERAVVGYVLGRYKEYDVITELKRQLHTTERAYWTLLNENQRLKAHANLSKTKKPKKRG